VKNLEKMTQSVETAPISRRNQFDFLPILSIVKGRLEMRDRKQLKFHWLINSLIAFSFSFLALACGKQEQMGGIVGEVKFNTQACVPQQKIINIRNDDTTNPQRVMGVYFELGTNENNYFKIDKVVVGGTEYEPSSNLAQEVLIPAGGTMAIHTTYTPRKITQVNDISYLDMFLNGPKLGILQIKMNGEAPTAKEGCSAGNAKEYKVTKATFIMNHQDFTSGQPREFDLEIVKDTLNLGTDSSGNITLAEAQDFPTLNLPLPAELGAPVPSLDITLDPGSYTGTMDEEGNIELRELNLKAVVISIPKVTLTTGSASLTEAKGSINLEGKKFQNNKGELVAALAVPDDPNLVKLKDGVFGLKLEIEAK